MLDSGLSGVFLLNLIFLIEDIFKQPGMRKICLAGFVQILIPVGLQSGKADILQFFKKFFIWWFISSRSSNVRPGKKLVSTV